MFYSQAREGHLSIVQLLVLAGADRDREDTGTAESPKVLKPKGFRIYGSLGIYSLMGWI